MSIASSAAATSAFQTSKAQLDELEERVLSIVTDRDERARVREQFRTTRLKIDSEIRSAEGGWW